MGGITVRTIGNDCLHETTRLGLPQSIGINGVDTALVGRGQHSRNTIGYVFCPVQIVI
jgi:hypothetical protein